MNGREPFGGTPDDAPQYVPLPCARSSPVIRAPKTLGWDSGRARVAIKWDQPAVAGGGAREGAEEASHWAEQVLADLAQHRWPGSIQYHVVGHVWLTQRLLSAARNLSQLITLDPAVRGGVPVLAGTRLPLARILAEVADDRQLSEIADDHELPAEMLMRIFAALAASLERPFTT